MTVAFKIYLQSLRKITPYEGNGLLAKCCDVYNKYDVIFRTWILVVLLGLCFMRRTTQSDGIPFDRQLETTCRGAEEKFHNVQQILLPTNRAPVKYRAQCGSDKRSGAPPCTRSQSPGLSDSGKINTRYWMVNLVHCYKYLSERLQ